MKTRIPRHRLNVTVDPDVRQAARTAIGDRGLSPLIDRLLDEWLRAGIPSRFRVVGLLEDLDEYDDTE